MEKHGIAFAKLLNLQRRLLMHPRFQRLRRWKKRLLSRTFEAY